MTIMSDESEDSTELRDLLFKALEKNGVISDVRAQLRSSVYTIIEQERLKRNSANPGLTYSQACLLDKTLGPANRTSLSLVREFLKKLKLLYTLNLLDRELSLDEVDLDYGESQGLSDSLPLKLGLELGLPAAVSTSTSDSTNKLADGNSTSTAAAANADVDISDLPVLSKLVATRCISRHPDSVQAEHRTVAARLGDFGGDEAGTVRTDLVIDYFGQLSATRNMPKMVIEAYIKEVLSDPEFLFKGNEDLAGRVLKLITENSREVLSSDRIFSSTAN